MLSIRIDPMLSADWPSVRKIFMLPPGAWRKGVGSALLSALVRSSEEKGIWTLQAGIFPENWASIELHRKVGFRLVGVRERLGAMDGRWRDVVLMERRSQTVGL